MMAVIGIVCEGSHDFCFLLEIVDEILQRQGHTINTIQALQPRVDATSMQMDGGGYEAVHQWLLGNKQIGLRKYFTPSLFATSPVYDSIIVHLDGDVADISSDFIASPYNAIFADVADRVSALKSWIFSLVQAEPAWAQNVVAAVPTLQMEAWILAALHPTQADIEAKNRKRATKRFLKKEYGGSAVEQVRAAGIAARQNVLKMAARAKSFDILASDLRSRFT